MKIYINLKSVDYKILEKLNPYLKSSKNINTTYSDDGIFRLTNNKLMKLKIVDEKGNPLNKNSNETNYENSASEQIAGQETDEGLNENVSETEEPILAGSEEYLQLLEKIKVANDAELGDLIANIKDLKATLNPIEGGQLMVAVAKRAKELRVSTGEDTGALAPSSTGEEIQNQLDDQLTSKNSINEGDIARMLWSEAHWVKLKLYFFARKFISLRKSIVLKHLCLLAGS